ncbi:condensation domain-containing protein, partial [Salinactinospora qingdaonensis]|uniref:condensation domain-containing protein n=1 Tax=Salinactinospora qingdaonensis TaxID=702744 RepID=UPI0031EDEA6E
LQEQNMQMRQYEYSPLNQVQQWSELPANAPLFETLFVFENYPVEKDETASLRFDMTRSEERVNYPLALVVLDEDQLEISAQYDTRRFEKEAIERMLGHLRSICSQITQAPEVQLSEINALTEEERLQILQQGTATTEETQVDADFDLSAFAAEIKTAEERELLEQLVAEAQGMSPSDLQVQDYRDE